MLGNNFQIGLPFCVTGRENSWIDANAKLNDDCASGKSGIVFPIHVYAVVILRLFPFFIFRPKGQTLMQIPQIDASIPGSAAYSIVSLSTHLEKCKASFLSL